MKGNRMTIEVESELLTRLSDALLAAEQCALASGKRSQALWFARLISEVREVQDKAQTAVGGCLIPTPTDEVTARFMASQPNMALEEFHAAAYERARKPRVPEPLEQTADDNERW
jgi:hypothetical protein